MARKKKEKFNVPIVKVERGMVDVCLEMMMENRSEQFKAGWLYFVRWAFPDNEPSPKFVYRPLGRSPEFMKGMDYAQRFISAFYSFPTRIGHQQAEEAEA